MAYTVVGDQQVVGSAQLWSGIHDAKRFLTEMQDFYPVPNRTHKSGEKKAISTG